MSGNPLEQQNTLRMGRTESGMHTEDRIETRDQRFTQGNQLLIAGQRHG
jgi:hypothetical protein